MTKEPFYVHCGKCSHEWVAAFLPLPVDVFAKLGKAPCPMCGAKNVLIGQLPKATANSDPLAWLENGDTGISSMTIWRVLMGRDAGDAWDNDIHYDPADFGRCYRLLQVMPAWRKRLPEVSERLPEWKPLVDAWDELTALYEEEFQKPSAPKLYRRMQELRGQEPA